MVPHVIPEPGKQVEVNRSLSDNNANLSGIFLEQTANLLTLGRAIGGLALGGYIESTPDYQSWKTVGAFFVLVMSDAEGYLSRTGRKFQGKNESLRRPWNSYADHLADKCLVDKIMLAIAERESANGSAIYSSTVDQAAKVTVARDVITTVDRIFADVQAIDTRAQAGGKNKALKQYLNIGFALSPLAKNKWGKMVAGAGFLYTAKESLTSGWSLHQSFSKQRKIKKAA